MTFLRKELRKHADSKKAKLLQGFFKTGKGEYGEGDVFLGVMVPNTRKVVNQFYKEATMNNIKSLLHTNIHEERLLALLILVKKYQTDKKDRKQIFEFYLNNTKYINNWDLVDLTAPNIVGDYLLDRNRAILYKLVKSNDLWEKRISILATFMFIKNNDFKDSIKIAGLLLKDNHDLIHKAVGWMLREIGKRNRRVEEQFLKKHYKKMPRTMLRYAIERFPEQKRKAYLNGKI
jgi:3-methyladenine DNA glycosylase AlkD